MMSRDGKILSAICVFITQLFVHVTGTTWYEYEGHCYATLNVRNSHQNSKSSCQQHGSYVVELNGMSELDYVRSIISGSNDQFWVGLDYNNYTEKYNWDRDGQEPLAEMWQPGEPDRSGFCVSLGAGSSAGGTFLLGDQPCSTPNKVICEKDADMLETVNYREVTVSSTYRCPTAPQMTRSKIHCARNCSKNKHCIGFQYNEDTQFCTAFKFSVSCDTTLSSSFPLHMRQYARC